MNQKFGSQETQGFESKMVISACVHLFQIRRAYIKTPAKRELVSAVETRRGCPEDVRRSEDLSAG